MDKKDFSVSLLLAGLTILFVLASFALFLLKGKSKFWTTKKMKLGAILLTITAATTIQSCEEETPMCYATAELNNIITIEDYSENKDLNENNTLKGIIEYRSSEDYSFTLKKDSLNDYYQKENLIADDGQFNDTTEAFTISLDTTIHSGKYTLSFYNTSIDSTGYSIADFHFNIKNSK